MVKVKFQMGFEADAFFAFALGVLLSSGIFSLVVISCLRNISPHCFPLSFLPSKRKPVSRRRYTRFSHAHNRELEFGSGVSPLSLFLRLCLRVGAHSLFADERKK